MTRKEIIKFLEESQKRLEEEGFVATIEILLKILKEEEDTEEYEYWKMIGATAPQGSGMKKHAKQVLTQEFGEDIDNKDCHGSIETRGAIEEHNQTFNH